MPGQGRGRGMTDYNYNNLANKTLTTLAAGDEKYLFK